MLKKVGLVVLLFMVIFLSSCDQVVATPLDNPKMDLFQLKYANKTYKVYERIEVDPEMPFYMIGYGVGIGEDTCIVGEYDRYMYIFEYKDNYYDILEANKLNLFSCDDLWKIGIYSEEE